MSTPFSCIIRTHVKKRYAHAPPISGLLHHFHNSLGLLRPNPLPKVLLRHKISERINFNPGLKNRINVNPILKLIRWINYMLKRLSITTYTGAEQIKCSNKKIIVLEKSIEFTRRFIVEEKMVLFITVMCQKSQALIFVKQLPDELIYYWEIIS